MCNRYNGASPESIKAAFDVKVDHDTGRLPQGELFPTRDGWIVRRQDGECVLDVAMWGFPPPPNCRAPVTNVRNYASPFWRSALANPDRRCLVPFTNFCEWEGEKGSKIARWFNLPSVPVAAFAGVWRPLEEGKAYAFLTTDPNPMVAPIHPKAMPVVLHPEDYDRWLSAPVEDALTLACAFPSQLMQVA